MNANRTTPFLVEPPPLDAMPERRRGPYARRNAGEYRSVNVETFLGAIFVPVVVLSVVAWWLQ